MVKVMKIIIEIREKLRACQFYIHTEESLIDPEINFSNSNLQIKDENGEFTLNLSDYLNDVPNSLTGLSQHGSILTFRIRTNPDGMYGSFRTEVVVLNENRETSGNCELNIPNNTVLFVFCKFCNSKISDKHITFNRILPLPSSGMEEGDYFCHKEDNQQMKCFPKTQDCLYGSGYICITSLILETSATNIIKCTSCSSYLGYKKESYLVLWTSSVHFNTEQPTKISDSTKEDFFDIINQTLQLETILNPKIILQNPYNSENLLIWIIEKDLNVLKIDSNKCTSKSVVRKVLYKLDNCSENIKQYINDPNSLVVETSPHVISRGLQYLAEQAEILPSEFRNTNSFSISFIERKYN